MPHAYYNEFDEKAAAWIRELIKAGLIAYGDVDTRSIEDVRPNDLRGYTQCHFFAGIGGWSLALRRAGWSDDRPVWTGSCPCQPFSSAGAGAGFADERHLWPAFFHLIDQRKPESVFGEQVASKDADPWIDLVHTDMEAVGYAFGAVAFPSAGVGAPHIRDRTYWMADRTSERWDGRQDSTRKTRRIGIKASRIASGLDNSISNGRGAGRNDNDKHVGLVVDTTIAARGMAHAGSSGLSQQHGRRIESEGLAATIGAPGPAPINGFWRDADWLGCTDGKWRPVEPGTFPLANGVSGRVGLLRGYGNAINVSAAQIFIEAGMTAIA